MTYPKQRRKPGLCDCGAPAVKRMADSVVCERCYELAHNSKGQGRRIIQSVINRKGPNA